MSAGDLLGRSAGARLVRASLVVCALALAYVLVAGGPAAAGARLRATPAKSHQRADTVGGVTIVSPRSGSLVTDRSVIVRVRTRRSAPRLDVRMYGQGDSYRTISGRFHRTGPGAFTARLSLGGLLKLGVNSIYVSSFDRSGRRVGYAETRFTVARRAGAGGYAPGSPRGGLLSVRRFERGRYERPPLDIRVAARPGATVRARLNGHPARSSFERRGRGRWVAHLGVKDGLRFGANRLVVTAFTRSGLYARVENSFEVGRGRPLVDAGRDMIAVVGRPVRPDGMLTRAAPGRRLALRWRVVGRPRGRRPRLLNATSARPRLITRVNGTYRLALSASDLRSGRAPAGRATSTRRGGARAVSAIVPGSTATDEMVVDAAPDVPPSGEPVQTIAPGTAALPTPGITVGQSFYPLVAGAAIQLLALDRTTLAVVDSASYTGAQTATLLSDLNGLDSGSAPCAAPGACLVILSGDGQSASYQSASAVQQAIQQIGGILSDAPATGVTSGQIPSSDGGQSQGAWSVIGIPGIPQGQAYQLIGLQQGAGHLTGAMSGSFRIDSSGSNFAFQWAPEYQPFDTSSSTQLCAGSSTQVCGNAMTVDGTSYPSWNLPFPGRTGKVGFQLLWFDADTMKLRDTATYDADETSAEQPQYQNEAYHGWWGLRDELRRIVADPKPAVVLINTIGSVWTPWYEDLCYKGHSPHDCNDWPTGSPPGPHGDVIARVASLLSTLGANQIVFSQLGDGRAYGSTSTGGYSFVGVTGLQQLKGPNAGAELSTRIMPHTVARLAGVLQRSRQGVLQPSSTGSPSPGQPASVAQPGILKLLAQPAQPFPLWSQLSTSQQQAQVTIANFLGLGSYVDTSATGTGIRAAYWQASGLSAADWVDMASTLNDICDPNVLDHIVPLSLCTTTLTQQATSIYYELKQVALVRGFFTSASSGLSGAFNDVFMSEAYGATADADAIRDVFQPPASEFTQGPSPLGILSGSLGITGAIGGFVPVVGEEFAAGADLAAGVADIVEASTDSSSGSGAALFDPYNYFGTVASVGSDLRSAFQNTLGSNGSLAQLANILVSDKGRLAAAAAEVDESPNAGGWDLDSYQWANLEDRMLLTMRQWEWLTLMQPVYATFECAPEDAQGVIGHNPAAALNIQLPWPQWYQQREHVQPVQHLPCARPAQHG